MPKPDRERPRAGAASRPPPPPRRAGRAARRRRRCAPGGRRGGAPELRVDGPGEQLRPSQVDADHAAGGHVGHHTWLHAGPPHGRPPSTSSTARDRACPRRGARRRLAAATSCASAPPGAPPQRRRPITVGRVVKWLAARARRRGSALSLVLFLISAQFHQDQVSRRRAGRSSSGGGVGIVEPQTTLVLGSDQRTTGTKEPGAQHQRARAARTRSCSCASAAATAPSSRSRATRSSTSPATAATRSTPPTRSAAPRSRSRRSSSTSASTINHVFEVNFDELPRRSSTRWAGSTTPAAASSRASTAASRTAASRCACSAGTTHIDGKQALALARTRKNACNPRENDLHARAPPAEDPQRR